MIETEPLFPGSHGLFEQTAVRQVVGITDARNTASVRLLERVGMSRVESRETVFKGEPCM